MVDYAVVMTNFAGAFPNIDAINVSAPGAGDGTEFIAALVNDIWGRAQALMDYAGLVPDGIQEAPDTAQILEAIGLGFGVGPGVGVTYWKNDTPAVWGDRVLLLQGQEISLVTYALLFAAVYVGDAANPTAPAFYATNGAGVRTLPPAATHFIIPDCRGLSLKNIGDATIAARVKTGPGDLGEAQEDQGQAWQLGCEQDSTGVRDYWSYVAARDFAHDSSALATHTVSRHVTTGQGDVRMLHAKNDGTNGDPREGLHVRDSTLGTNYGITY